MKKIIYPIFALVFTLTSCDNSATDAGHDHNSHQHDEDAAHDHGTHEHDNGEVHEDHGHDHHQEEFTVEDTLTK